MAIGDVLLAMHLLVASCLHIWEYMAMTRIQFWEISQKNFQEASVAKERQTRKERERDSQRVSSVFS